MGQIQTKAAHFRDLRQTPAFQRARAAADLYVAAFLLPKTGAAPAVHSRTVPTTDELWQALAGQATPAMVEAAKTARRAQAFHWPLEFPDVMERGGFDVVLGNPPWERIKLQEQEFFASRSGEIADAPNKAARDRLIKALATAPIGSADRRLWDAFIQAKRLSEAITTFVHVAGVDGGRFPLTGRGDVNTYALFTELAATSAARAGVIVPTGVATDATTAPFFAHLVEKESLASLVDFENRAGLFPGVHRSFKFCLLTMGQREPAAQFAFFLTDPAQLAVSERSFTLSPWQIAAINPNTLTSPVFRSREDGELTAKIYGKVPILMEDNKGPQGNPWGVHFARLFDMSNDSNLFRTAAALSDGDNGPSLPPPEPEQAHRYAPLYEAKMIHQFDHRWASFGAMGKIMVPPPAQKADPHWEPTPRYWVTAEEVTARLDAKGWNRSWLLGQRNIARATDERTVIASIIPRCAVGNKLPLMLPSTDDHLAAIPGLLGALTSLTCDFVARQKVGGTHLNFFIIKQFPILPPSFYSSERLTFVTPRVLALTYTSHALALFAQDLGYSGPPFPWDEQRRALLRAELDAFYARAYGLSRDELRYILDPADVMGPDYPSETFRGLKEKEIKAHGEYRTQRLVLAAWDELEACGGFAALGM